MKNRDRIKKQSVVADLIIALLVLVIIFCAYKLYQDYAQDRRDREEAGRLASIADMTTEPTTEATTAGTAKTEAETEPPFVSPIRFEELKKINPDIVGWITIPDTNIDYPIVQAEDNDIYLHKSFEGEESKAGAIFLDCDSNGDFTGRNNIIYGHHMRNGSMFKDVVKFKEKEYFDAHREAYIYMPERTIHLKLVSAYYGDADPAKRQTRFESQEEFDEYVREVLKPCSYAEIPQEPVETIYTLITCSYEFDDARTFLYAVEIKDE